MTAITDNLSPSQTQDMTYVRIWLQMICVLIFIMVMVGGATRLTDSGLSITEWKPILGAIPPLNAQDWQEALDKYRQIPEYQQVNKGMSLAEFKFIYWWEWAHRFLGRFIGLAFLLPFLFFVFTKKVSGLLTYKLFGIFVLGGLQGFMGWYMVKSGLVDRVDVSQYRLAAHLGLAILIFGLCYWLSLNLTSRRSSPLQTDNMTQTDGMALIKFSALGLIVGTFLQIILGAFVAGLRAGNSHNTWPLMDGQFIPDGLFIMSPWYINFFENVLTVQFDHRMLAYVLIVWSVVHVYWVSRRFAEGDMLISALLLCIAFVAQIALGIWTLLAQVPIHLGLVHQAGALVVLMLAIWHVHVFYRSYDKA